MPIVNKALVKSQIGWVNSIVTVFDSGGDTGRQRTDERGNLLAFSDYWRALMSLWIDGAQKSKWEELLRFRDGRGRNFGNSFFVFLKEQVNEVNSVARWFGDLVMADMAGEVIPVCLSPSNICFKVKSGAKFEGEHRLDELRMSQDEVVKIWLDPSVVVNKRAVDVLAKADLIVVCPGSMYGSVLVNFMVDGFCQAFIKSKAKKILMTNVMSVRNENHGFDQDKYIKVFEKYIGKKGIFDFCLMADLTKLDKSILKKVFGNYDFEYSKPIMYKKKSKNKVVLADIATIDKKNLRLRHSVEKLANWFKSEFK